MATGKFFHDNAVACLVFNKESLDLIDVNAKCSELYGYSEKELLENMTVTDLLSPDEDMAFVIESLRSPDIEKSPALMYLKKKDGARVQALTFLKNVKLNGYDCVSVMAIDTADILSSRSLPYSLLNSLT